MQTDSLWRATNHNSNGGEEACFLEKLLHIWDTIFVRFGLGLFEHFWSLSSHPSFDFNLFIMFIWVSKRYLLTFLYFNSIVCFVQNSSK